jgi:hypothetical protein
MNITKIAASLRHLVKAERLLVAFGVNDLKKLYNAGRCFGVISAYRSEYSKTENQQRHGQLVRDLQKAGYRNVVPLRSKWTDTESGITTGEKSILIPDVPFSLIFALGNKYQQQAVLYKDPSGSFGVYHADGTAEMVADRSKVFHSTDRNKEYSKGRSMSFGLEFIPDIKFQHNGHAIPQEEVDRQLQLHQQAAE